MTLALEDREDVPKDRGAAWLAEATGVPENTIRDALRRGPSKPQTALRIAKALSVSVEWLLTGVSPDDRRTRAETGLSASEQELVTMFRALSLREQGAALAMVSQLAGMTWSLEEISARAARGREQRAWLEANTALHEQPQTFRGNNEDDT